MTDAGEVTTDAMIVSAASTGPHTACGTRTARALSCDDADDKDAENDACIVPSSVEVETAGCLQAYAGFGVRALAPDLTSIVIGISPGSLSVMALCEL
jgi:hypothetical protein